MDSATEGVIFFSMGSVLQSTQWRPDKLDALLKAFGKLKQKVIWKYENPSLPNKPDNVMISPWLPQRDLMTHPNLKLFITHGGLLGTTEALIEGIALLGFPIFGDQKMNMAKAVERGYALQIYFHDITEESLSRALKELLTNPKYHENAKIYSKRYNDRPMTPQQTVTYWTEYAVKHQGAPHLRSASATRLNYFEIRSWDVYFVLFLIGIFVIIINFYILKTCLRKCFGKSTAVRKEKRK
jgi:glucuronosyltransferase